MIALAIDLGAGSGRAVAGQFDGRRLVVHEIYRFPNNPVRIAGRLHWDILRLYHEIGQAIAKAHRAERGAIASLGIDAWGVDFGLLDSRGELLGNPYHYRDEGTRGMMAEVLRVVPREEVFARTGIQFMPLNTLYQLYAIARANPSLLEEARTLLMIPDLLRAFLTGEQSSEYTNASTTQFLNIASGDWDRALLASLGLPTALLTEIVPPAIPAGHLLPEVAAELGIPTIPVATVASHDTAAAVVGVPAEGQFAFLSSGTWSLLGTELTQPVLDAQALAWNFTNEGEIRGAYRLLKNILGLWLIERCRHVWEQEGSWRGYEAMAAEAAAAVPFRSLIDPNDPSLLNPRDMPRAIVAACQAAGEPLPETPGAIARCIMESLALAYRLVLERTEQLSGLRFPGLHVVGGGVQNTRLLAFTAAAIGRPVWGGPVEATAIGNLLCQLMASGHVGSLAEGRTLVRESFPPVTFEPCDTPAWDEAYARFLHLLPD